ncbi:thiol:disulfide interchange protein DsbG [Chromobacterium violaceum]|uniref:thiol:disulfide interchange protein DsbG n=1 Tax=Chromobacterium violaceum TaxID=536 RepID=UPI0009DA2886|nr:thiol:disulfide interchange protein DsbG [Chromobacterium violaceum]ATP29034.1 thiol:disulfide interchange protein DsbG [Chromobacterium violaceum]ATP32943.1 thiol:disulfide interchange protein DsbG [Chromobacterium violaceum]MCD0494658.1 thiol:disulfide interchange protein DsbG [Chromobacterium violaceum]OQS09934.1 thiol:disulfide interchange protein DsbG [Chromobacterium violaceum]OQS26069.1 thiol:disulfide interchange protein DsbG [Chromobacterium violaceum]
MKPACAVAIAVGHASLSAAAAAAWPAPIQALEQQGYEILGRFDGPSGMAGYAALRLGRPQTLYLTPDGKYAIAGTMTDAGGENWNQAGVDQRFSDAMWEQLQGSAWIADGSRTAERVVYLFTDPNCPYCRQFWRDARPWVRSGKVQLRHILIGILQADSRGKAAAILADADPARALARHEGGADTRPLGQPPAAVEARLDANHRLMERLGAFATPAIYYRAADGSLQKAQGAPGAAALPKILGPR